MSRISNVNKAFNQIEERASQCKEILTKDFYNSLLDAAIDEFNLDESKTIQLKAMNFTHQIVDLSEQVKSHQSELVNTDFHKDESASHESCSFSVAKEEIEPPTFTVESSPQEGVKSILQQVVESTDFEETKIDHTFNEVIELKAVIKNLELAIAKIGTLAGYGNYLREFGLEVWKPRKKDMGRNYGK